MHNKTIWSVLMCGVIFTTVVVFLQKACGQVTTLKGTKVKIRLGASSGEWKAMVADEAARTTFAKNIKTVLEKNKLDGIDLDFEWAENEKEYKDYSLAILKMREVLGNKYLFSVSLHPVCYKISKEAIEAVDFISLQCYGPSPVRFPIEKYCSDIQMVWWQEFLSMV